MTSGVSCFSNFSKNVFRAPRCQSTSQHVSGEEPNLREQCRSKTAPSFKRVRSRCQVSLSQQLLTQLRSSELFPSPVSTEISEVNKWKKNCTERR